MSISRLMQMAAAGVPKGEPWLADLANASYDGVSFSVAGQDTNPRAISFNNDGTKLFLVGDTANSIFQYSLSTGFDLSTISYDSVSFSVSGQDASPSGLLFNNDGIKMYVVGFGGDAVYQYSLSTAFDLSTASYDSVSFSVSGQDTLPLGMVFNNDGSKLFIVGGTNDSVYQYSLSTAFDLSTISYDSVSLSVASQTTAPYSPTFSPDGTKMYLTGGSSVFQYSLSTGFDLSTASYDSISFSTSGFDTVPRGLLFNEDGTKMYLSGGSNDALYQVSTA